MRNVGVWMDHLYFINFAKIEFAVQQFYLDILSIKIENAVRR